MIWVFIIQGGLCAVIGIVVGWFGRGGWDRLGRKPAELPQRDRPLFSPEDWEQIDRLANGGGR